MIQHADIAFQNSECKYMLFCINNQACFIPGLLAVMEALHDGDQSSPKDFYGLCNDVYIHLRRISITRR